MVVTSCISVQHLRKYGFAKSSDNLYAPCILQRVKIRVHTIAMAVRIRLVTAELRACQRGHQTVRPHRAVQSRVTYRMKCQCGRLDYDTLRFSITQHLSTIVPQPTVIMSSPKPGSSARTSSLGLPRSHLLPTLGWSQSKKPLLIYHRHLLDYSFIHQYSALEAGLAGTRAQSCDRYGSGTLHPGQVLGGSLPLLSPPPLDVPTFAARCLCVRNDARDPSSERWNCGRESCLR